jgi:uncharacterized protein (DUF952 family)
MTTEQLLVHICPRQDWLAAQASGAYRAASLESVGFIHCSRPEQAPGVLQRFFAGASDLLLLWIDPRLLRAELRWEQADGDLFPHLYGELNLDAVVRVEALANQSF